MFHCSALNPPQGGKELWEFCFDMHMHTLEREWKELIRQIEFLVLESWCEQMKSNAMAQSVISFIVVTFLLFLFYFIAIAEKLFCPSEISFHAFDQAFGVLIRILLFFRTFSFAHFSSSFSSSKTNETWEIYKNYFRLRKFFVRSMANHHIKIDSGKNTKILRCPHDFYSIFFSKIKNPKLKYKRTVFRKRKIIKIFQSNRKNEDKN